MFFQAFTTTPEQSLAGQSRKRQNPIRISIVLYGSNLQGATLKFLCKAIPTDADEAAVISKTSGAIAENPVGGDFQLRLVTPNRAVGQMAIASADTQNLMAPITLTYAFQLKFATGTDVEELESGTFTIVADLIRNAN